MKFMSSKGIKMRNFFRLKNQCYDPDFFRMFSFIKKNKRIFFCSALFQKCDAHRLFIL